MKSYEIIPLSDSTILYLYAIRDKINLDPSYQRMSDVWNRSKRQVLIDSIVNSYDIPKIYLHELPSGKDIFKYSVIDGKQRLSTIFSYIDNNLALADDFTYNFDSNIDARGLTYAELSIKYPMLKIKFDSKVLPVHVIRTDDEDIIEDMFARLNEASPLNAAEKRNAFGGPVPKAIRDISSTKFFKYKIRTGDSRYKHYEIAVKLMYLIHRKSISDTNKIYLDGFTKQIKDEPLVESIKNQTISILDQLCNVFQDKDDLLRNAGLIPVYFWVQKILSEKFPGATLSRQKISDFEEERSENRKKAQDQTDAMQPIDIELLEYDRLVQTPNDGYSIRYKCEILAKRTLPEIQAQEIIDSVQIKVKS
jgi:hypothetical protein